MPVARRLDPQGDLPGPTRPAEQLHAGRALADAVAPFRAWLTRRRCHQAATRNAMPVFENVGGHSHQPLALATSTRPITCTFPRAALEPLYSLHGYLSDRQLSLRSRCELSDDARSGRWSWSPYQRWNTSIHLSGLDLSADRRITLGYLHDAAAAPARLHHGRPKAFEDEWTRAESAEALAEQWPLRLPPGVVLTSTRPASQPWNSSACCCSRATSKSVDLVLDDLSLVAALRFRRSTTAQHQGRAAARSRHGFERALRAVGQVLVDQLPYAARRLREFEVSHPTLIARLEGQDRQHSAAIPADRRKESHRKGGQGYSWRRVRDSSEG